MLQRHSYHPLTLASPLAPVCHDDEIILSLHDILNLKSQLQPAITIPQLTNKVRNHGSLVISAVKELL